MPCFHTSKNFIGFPRAQLWGWESVTPRTCGSCRFKSQSHTYTLAHTPPRAARALFLLLPTSSLLLNIDETPGTQRTVPSPAARTRMFGSQESPGFAQKSQVRKSQVGPAAPEVAEWGQTGTWRWGAREGSEGREQGTGRMAAFCKLQGCLLATDNTFGSTWLAKAPETRPARRGTGALPSYF